MEEENRERIKLTETEVNDLLKSIVFDLPGKIDLVRACINDYRGGKLPADENKLREAFEVFEDIKKHLTDNLALLRAKENYFGVDELLALEQRKLSSLEELGISKDRIKFIVDNYGTGNDYDVLPKLLEIRSLPPAKL